MKQNVKFQRFYETKTMKDYLMNKGRNILIDGKRRSLNKMFSIMQKRLLSYQQPFSNHFR